MSYIANTLRPEGDPRIVEGGRSSLTPADNLARALGWFSLALGLTELIGARRLSRAVGLEGSEGMVRALGAREIGAGIMTLSTERKLGLQSRVAGDVMDLLALGTALDAPRQSQRKNALIALLAVGGVTALDILASRALKRERARDDNLRHFSDRSGFPKGVAASRGAARQGKPEADLKASVASRPAW